MSSIYSHPFWEVFLTATLAGVVATSITVGLVELGKRLARRWGGRP